MTRVGTWIVPAQGVAEQEEAAGIEPESLTHLLELVDEPVDLPESGVVRLVTVGTAMVRIPPLRESSRLE
jgi:hypothetical protein